MLRRIALYTGGVVSILLLLPMLLAAWLLFTESGLRWSWSQAQPWLPLEVQVGRLNGSWWGGVDVQQLALSAPSLDWGFESLSATRVTLRWQPLALLVGRVNLDQLTLDQLKLVLPATEAAMPSAGDAPAAPVLPELDLPINLAINQLHLRNTEIITGNQVVRIPDASLQAAMGGSRLVVGALNIRYDDIDYQFNARVTFAHPLSYQLVLASHGISSQGQCWIEQGDYACDGKLQWQGFSHPYVEWVDMATPSGALALKLRGHLLDVKGEGDYIYRLEQAPIDTRVALEGQVNLLDESARVTHFVGQFAGGDVNAQGEMNWRQGYELSLLVDARDVSLAHWLPEWMNESKASVRSDLSLSASGEGVYLTVRSEQVTGFLGSQALEGSIIFELDPQGLGFPQAVITGPGSELSFNADWRFDQTLHIQSQFHSDSLEALAPELHGQADAQWSLADEGENVNIQLSARAKDLALPGYQLGSLQLDGHARHIDQPSARAWLQTLNVDQLTLAAEDVVVGNTALGDAQLTASGSAQAHTLSVQWARPDFPLQLEQLNVDGQWQWDGVQALAQSHWQGKVAQLQFSDAWHVDGWRLEQPVAFLLSAGQQRLGDFCLVQKTARLCSQSIEHKAGGAAELKGSLQGYYLDREHALLTVLAQPLPSGVQLGGELSADWDLHSSGSDNLLIDLAVHWLTPAMSIVQDDDERISLPIEKAEITLKGDQQKALLKGALNLDQRQAVHLEGELSQWFSANGILQMHINGNMQRLTYLQPLFPDIASLSGRASANLGIEIPFSDDARYTGKIEIADMAFTVPAFGSEFSAWKIQAEAGQSSLLVSGTGQVGEGLAKVDGHIKASGDDSVFNAELTVTGDKLGLVNMPDVSLHASPDLTLKANGRRWHLGGGLSVEDAKLTLRSIPATASGLSEDAVVYDETEQLVTPASLIQFTTDLVLSLDDNVEFEGFGLQTELEGNLRFTRALDKSQSVQGIIKLPSGQFKSYGQKLQIENGQIIFSGPVDNPALDVRAARYVEGVTAGLWLHGTAKHPKTEVYSSPAMSEADVLAYIVTGKPISDSGSGELIDMQTAALNMGLKQALPVLQKLGNQFGITDISLEDNAEGESSIAAGRKINDRIYVKYVYGILGAAGDFVVQYKITDRLKLETSSGATQAIDVTYSWDSKPPDDVDEKKAVQP